jgi:ribosomal protein L7/L12
VDVASGRVVRCRYCGASLAVQEPTAAETRETYVVSIDAVGPSNREGIARLVAKEAGVSPDEAIALVRRAPCELVVWDDYGRAHELRRALLEAGARASLTARLVEIPGPVLLPPADVLLDDVGASKAAVLKVVREHIDLGLVEAKNLVESAPCVLIRSLEGSRANALRDALVRVGARARTA